MLNKVFAIDVNSPNQEHCEIDAARGFAHHFLQVFLGWVLSEGCQHIMQVFVVKKAIRVMIDHGKGFFKFSDLLLVEHGKDVGVLPHCSFLFLLAQGLEL